MATAKKSKGLTLLETTMDAKTLAAQYYSRAKKDVHRDMIDSLEREIENRSSMILELEDMSLETDKNAGRKRLTQEEVTTRFKKSVKHRADQALAEIKLKELKKAFDVYFS